VIRAFSKGTDGEIPLICALLSDDWLKLSLLRSSQLSKYFAIIVVGDIPMVK